MSVRSSIGGTPVDVLMHRNGNSISTPLRRKSMLLQKTINTSISENDDEAEKFIRRQEIAVASTSNVSPGEKRRSIGFGVLTNMPAQKITEKIAECIRLNARNKINLKNAFSLEMIDFMAYMIKRQDQDMTSWQMGTTSLAVSTKIYGYRVDGVHMEILRMLGVSDKQSKNEEDKTMDGTLTNVEEGPSTTEVKKKKKRSKQRIFVTPESLRTNVEIAKPSMIAIRETDVQTSDSLNQSVLPLHATSGFYLHPYNDVIVDSVKEGEPFDSTIRCSIPRIDDFSEMDICPALCNFGFRDWTVDSEPDEMETEERRESGNRFQFDMDASLPEDNDNGATSMNYFDIEHSDSQVEENVNRCAPSPNRVENIVDFRTVLSNNRLVKKSEYSFIQKGLNIHWAGPSHWKVRNFKKNLNNAETCARQAKSRRRKGVDVNYDEDKTEEAKRKFLPGFAINLQPKTAKTEWTEEALILPVDMHYSIGQALKCYLQPVVKSEWGGDLDEKSSEANESNEDYNDNVENNISFHSADECDANDKTGERLEEEPLTNSQMPFTGDNLIAAPKLANKLAIGYSTRDKKIDMRELKRTIWGSLTADRPRTIDQQSTARIDQSKLFSQVYKTLPMKLTKTNAEALSFPISFVSLLHLANEKTLKIHTPPDMSDVIVESG